LSKLKSNPRGEAHLLFLLSLSISNFFRILQIFDYVFSSLESSDEISIFSFIGSFIKWIIGWASGSIIANFFKFNDELLIEVLYLVIFKFWLEGSRIRLGISIIGSSFLVKKNLPSSS